MWPPFISNTLKPVDYIIVVSSGIRADGTPDATTHGRVMRGVALYKQGLAPKIVMSGGHVAGSPRDHASAMVELAVANGVPHSDLIREGQSRSTLQNALFTAEQIGTDPSVILVTSRFHTTRTALSFRLMGFRSLQIVASEDQIKSWPWENLVREVAAYGFNALRLPVWYALNLFGRAPRYDWILA